MGRSGPKMIFSENKTKNSQLLGMYGRENFCLPVVCEMNLNNLRLVYMC